GIAVANSGDNAVIGAWGDSNTIGSSAGSAYVFSTGCAVPTCCAGDFNTDHAVTAGDVPGFVAALLTLGTCPAQPACCPGDLNSDGLVNGTDISGFVTKLLAGGACP